MATSAQEEFVLGAADHWVLRCFLPHLLYSSNSFSLQSEAHTSPLSSANLTNSPREGKSLCNQRHCLRPDTESFGKATTLSYSPNCPDAFRQGLGGWSGASAAAISSKTSMPPLVPSSAFSVSVAAVAIARSSEGRYACTAP